MKRSALWILGAMLCGFAVEASAAPRPAVAVGAVSPIAVLAPSSDGQSFFVEVDESRNQLGVDEQAVMEPEGPAMHWSPRRGFHADKGCCKTSSAGTSRARISMQRFAGIDPAANRPMYVGPR